MSIRIYSPIRRSSSTYVMDLTAVAQDVSASEAWLGGYKLFRLRLAEPFDVSELRDMYRDLLGYHLVEDLGGVTWAGMVYQIDRASGFSRVRRSLLSSSKPVYNAVRVAYNGGVTAWASDADSIARYGQIDKEFKLNSSSSSRAVLYRDKMLAMYKDVRPEPLGMSREQDESIELFAVGYQVVGAMRLSTAVLSGTVTDGVKALVGEMDGVSEGVIASISDVIVDGEIGGETVWKRLEALMGVAGDGYRLWVDGRRRLNVVAVGDTPTFYRLLDGVRLARSGAVLEPYEVRPGVWRDETASPPETVVVGEVRRKYGRDVVEPRGAVGMDADL